MSSSDLSSPIHNTKSACLPLSTIDVNTFSATLPLLTPCGFTSTINWPLFTAAGSFASTLSRWSSISLAWLAPKPGSASLWCHTKALSLVSMEEPSVASVYNFITGSAI
uniref:Trehalose-6-phosphate synthase n=1 Tax=Rhizophora mucronata TaxID=61149 RepID=A0A2P2M7I5_RHIMU